MQRTPSSVPGLSSSVQDHRPIRPDFELHGIPFFELQMLANSFR